jgi:hypothetical protein
MSSANQVTSMQVGYSLNIYTNSSRIISIIKKMTSDEESKNLRAKTAKDKVS